jgi:hypothetical protein
VFLWFHLQKCDIATAGDDTVWFFLDDSGNIVFESRLDNSGLASSGSKPNAEAFIVFHYAFVEPELCLVRSH